MSTSVRQSKLSEGFRIIDASGCLTLEVLCFTDQLNPAQRAAVERHTRTCSTCAQQQTALARAGERFRREYPEQTWPVEIPMQARQAALRAIIANRERAGLNSHSPARRTTRHQPWHRSRTFWMALLAGGAAALLLWLLVFFVF